MNKIIRITTVPRSLGGLLSGQLKYMSQYYEVIGISSKDGDLLEKVGNSEEIQVLPVEMTRKITPLRDLKAVYEIYKILKKEKPEIVHSHTPKAGTLGMLAAYIARVPHRLHTIAGLPLLEASGPKRSLLDFVEKITYRCATMIYPNSYGLHKIILDNKYTTSNKLKVLANGSSNGIDTSHFSSKSFSDPQKQLELKKSLSISENDYIFVFVGRLVRDKGIHELIEAFSKLSKENHSIKLLLVGTYEKDLDPLSESVESEINTNSNIISVGWQDDVRPYFSIADVLAFPSYREGFPNVVLQAGAMGLPCIVSDINGCNEIIINGVNGIIVPPKNSSELYEAMKHILFNPDVHSKLAANSRTNITEKYERQAVWDAIKKEYDSLLAT